MRALLTSSSPFLVDNNTTSLAHTPTPWHVLTTPIECLIRAENFEETFQNIAATPGLNRNAEANAAFIVRACNAHDALLDACKMLLKVLSRDCDAEAFGSEISHAEGVIAQAEA